MKLVNGTKVNIPRISLFFFSMIILVSIFNPAILQAASQVTVHYEKSSGSELVVEILVGSPPPTSLIFVQTLPADVIIEHTKPQAKSINAKKGKAKWLLRNLQPGKLSIRISLNREVRRDEISGEIRYKASERKGMIVEPVK